MNWDNPSARARLINEVGVGEYNRLHDAHMQASTVATINGYAIRPVQTRFGRLFALYGTKVAFGTLAQAEAHALTLPPR